MPRHERIVAALTALLLVPVWLFRWFPTQDGPSHLYNAFVLARIGDPANVFIRQFFAVNLRPFPNWTMYVVLAPLTRIVSPLAAQQLLISLCIITISGTAVVLQRAFKTSVDGLAIAGPLLGYSYLLFMGFFNFILGAALFVFTISAWSRGRNIVVVYVLLIVTYFSHGLAFAATLLALTVLAVAARRWVALLQFAPAYVVVLIDAFARGSHAAELRPFDWHVQHLFDLAPFDFFGAAHVWIARVVFVLIVVAAARTRRFQPMMFVTGALLLGYFLAPWGYGAGGWAQGSWISERLLFLALLTLPAWLDAPRYSLAVLIVLFLVQFGLTTREIAGLSRDIGSLGAHAQLIRPHSVVQSIGSPPEITRRVTPTLHVASYLSLVTDVVDLNDYEARLPDFPIVFKSGATQRQPDYVLVWRNAHVGEVRHYRLLMSNDELRLFGRSGP